MIDINTLGDEVIAGKAITSEEALEVYNYELEPLCAKANEIRKHFCANGFDICTIINARSGRCPENCKYCAQSIHYHTKADIYPLLSIDEIVAKAKIDAEQGILRYSIVTSGRKLTEEDVEIICEAIRRIREEVGIYVCCSVGLLSEEQYRTLKEAGLSRVHNNLETSRRNFPNICTTHKFDDKINAIKAAQRAGLSICSGGIMGLGETVEDRIDMAMTLRELGVHSIPVNMLNPIPGTPLENNRLLTVEDMRRICATYRFILPDASIRLAGGRGLLPDKGASCFESGANAAISDNMLTTAGIHIGTDREMMTGLGYEFRFGHE